MHGIYGEILKGERKREREGREDMRTADEGCGLSWGLAALLGITNCTTEAASS